MSHWGIENQPRHQITQYRLPLILPEKAWQPTAQTTPYAVNTGSSCPCHDEIAKPFYTFYTMVDAVTEENCISYRHKPFIRVSEMTHDIVDDKRQGDDKILLAMMPRCRIRADLCTLHHRNSNPASRSLSPEAMIGRPCMGNGQKRGLSVSLSIGTGSCSSQGRLESRGASGPACAG